jgi:hypothetical protein
MIAIKPMDIALSAGLVIGLLVAYAITGALWTLIAVAALPFAQIIATITLRIVLPSMRESSQTRRDSYASAAR